MATLNRRRAAGLFAESGLLDVLSRSARSHPAGGVFPQGRVAQPGAVLGRGLDERTCAAYRLTSGQRRRRRANAGPRFAGRLGAGALPFPLKRCSTPWSICPFALPTAVAGLVYSSLYVPNGWLGQYLVPLGHQGAYSRLGIVLVLIFTGFPFVVRTVQPVLEGLEPELEEAASTLGANRAGKLPPRALAPLGSAAVDRLRPGLRPRLWASTARWSSSPATSRFIRKSPLYSLWRVSKNSLTAKRPP